MSETFTLHTSFDLMRCKTCGLEYMIPAAFHAALRNSKAWWHCPNGHQWHYTENEADKLRRERDQLAQRIAQKDDEIAQLDASRDRAWSEVARQERKLSAAKGQITKIKKRVHGGVCPCCNRTFSDLAKHMAGKHPGFIAEPSADEHVN